MVLARRVERDVAQQNDLVVAIRLEGRTEDFFGVLSDAGELLLPRARYTLGGVSERRVVDVVVERDQQHAHRCNNGVVVDHGMPSALCACSDSRHSGCAMTNSTHRRVLSALSGESSGCT